ncbi:MAG: 4-amino-4-deoxy-L-arabinose transferase-like glycosyltransferase [Planctomycetota bacterium]
MNTDHLDVNQSSSETLISSPERLDDGEFTPEAQAKNRDKPLARRMASRATFLLLLIVLASNSYRATTQSITTDEALTFTTWVDGSWSEIIEDYIPNNHVLHTILAKVSVDTFGIHAWSFRLPSLLGGAFFLCCLFQLTKNWHRPWIAFCAVAAVALNPFLLDYMSAARGYGLAAASLLAAFIAATCLVHNDTKQRQHWLLMGFSSGLAVAFNLAFFFAVCALTLSTLINLCSQVSRDARKVMAQFAVCFVVPAAAIILGVVVPVQRVTGLGHFSFGAKSMHEMTTSLVQPTFFHDPSSLPVERFLDFVPAWCIPALVAILVVIAIFQISWFKKRPSSIEAVTLRIASLALGISLLGLFVANWTLKLPYPKSRTGIYLVLFLSIALSSLVGQIARWRQVAGIFCLPILLIPIVIFAAQFPSAHYADWKFDANSESIYDWIEMNRPRSGDRKVRVLCVPFQHEPSLNFYRRSRSAKWLAPVERSTIHGVPRPGIYGSTYDFLVQIPGWQSIPSTQERYKVIYQDDQTGTLISVPK